MSQLMVSCLQALFWLSITLTALPALQRLRERWAASALASEFSRECRRRGLRSTACLRP